jgi:hypothetical protein
MGLGRLDSKYAEFAWCSSSAVICPDDNFAASSSLPVDLAHWMIFSKRDDAMPPFAEPTSLRIPSPARSFLPILLPLLLRNVREFVIAVVLKVIVRDHRRVGLAVLLLMEVG